MVYCVNCAMEHPDGTKFCRRCGAQQVGIPLLERLRDEARTIQAARRPAVAQGGTSTLDRLEQARRLADEATRRRTW